MSTPKKPTASYTDLFSQLETAGTISTRGLKSDATHYCELIFDVNSAYFDNHGGYEFAIAVNDNVDTLNGESELAPFLNILNEMHARQTSKKVKAARRSGLIRRRAGLCHLFSIQYRWVRVPSCGS